MEANGEHFVIDFNSIDVEEDSKTVAVAENKIKEDAEKENEVKDSETTKLEALTVKTLSTPFPF